MSKFYLTTAIPYVNAKPHVGHALEFVQADVVARYHRLRNEDVRLLSGADENALKNVQAAENAGKPVQEFVDENAVYFQELAEKLNIQFDIFQKGSSEQHHKSSQKLWELCAKNEDIYKKTYTGLYCVGCEQFYEPDELDKNGECFEHPGKPLEKVSEENYFFALSKYQQQIEELIENNTITIIPESRKNEILSFIKTGLKDISISRSNQRAKNWGVTVPGDDTQKMYVWFDALNIYQSGIGFGWDEEEYAKWWPADLHVIGKGILRFHAVYWPAFLLSAGLKLPQSIFVHGYFTVDGQKMSKTLGNVVDPVEMIDIYGVDALRYYFLREIPSTGDGDFSQRRLKEVYNADLANELGNLVARLSRLCEEKTLSFTKPVAFDSQVEQYLSTFQFNLALEVIWEKIKKMNQQFNIDQPWKITEPEKLTKLLGEYVEKILIIAYNLRPFLPETARKIQDIFEQESIQLEKPLFPKLS